MKEQKVAFIDIKLKETFESLAESSEKNLAKFINRAIDDLKKDPYCGVHISRKLIPKKYIQDPNISNLWKYNLPNAWRLLYTIKQNRIEIISIILEWMTHKDYDRLFNYNS
jgi:Txe/YoeB family toxin of Txe-Axe toxin-antitoxin module